MARLRSVSSGDPRGLQQVRPPTPLLGVTIYPMIYSEGGRVTALMDERLEIGAVTYPLVRHAQGGPAPDNNALLVEAATADGEPVRFALSLADVQHFVVFLLISVGKIGASRGD